jgi:hypothetical protein
MTASGQYLLSGGMLLLNVSIINIGALTDSSTDNYATLCLWSLQTGKLLQKIDLALHGAISAGIWLEADGSDIADQFVIGCADGSLNVYQRKGDLASIFHGHLRLPLMKNYFRMNLKKPQTSPLTSFDQWMVSIFMCKATFSYLVEFHLHSCTGSVGCRVVCEFYSSVGLLTK